MATAMAVVAVVMAAAATAVRIGNVGDGEMSLNHKSVHFPGGSWCLVMNYNPTRTAIFLVHADL